MIKSKIALNLCNKKEKQGWTKNENRPSLEWDIVIFKWPIILKENAFFLDVE